MTSKERSRNIERLKIQLEILRFKERGGLIKELEPQVVPKIRAVRDHILVPDNVEIQTVFVIDEFLERGVS